jgi:hypothetical protein
LPSQMTTMGGIGGDAALITIASPYARKYLTTTILAFKNILDWMGADERLIACSALLAPSPQHGGRAGGPGAGIGWVK